MKEKIEALIAKYTELDKAEQMVEAGEILEDLQSLQEPTEERDEVEIKRYDYWMDEGQCTLGDCVCGYKRLRIDSKYCSGCGAKIKRID